jgi:hypothetical protein
MEEPMWKKISVIEEPFNNYVEVYRVPSDSVWNAAYMVAKTSTGEWNCSCPDWLYRRPEGGCKHMLYVEMWKKENNVIVPAPAVPVEFTRFAALDV